MEPTISVGSLIVSEKTDIESVRVGDIVCFRSKSPDMLGKIITHRVTEITVGKSGETLLVTKGDANLTVDGYYVDAGNLVGVVSHIMGDSNFLSNIVSFLTSKSGFMICIALPAMLISGHILKGCVGSMKSDMTKIVDQMAKEDKEREEKIKRVSDPSSTAKQGGESAGPTEQASASDSCEIGAADIDQAEYEAMCERIKAELMAELKEELNQRGEEGEQSK